MTEYDYWKLFPRMPRKVTFGDITIRDGFQHRGKVRFHPRPRSSMLEELIFAGCRHIEVTNLGNPFLMPQFRRRGGTAGPSAGRPASRRKLRTSAASTTDEIVHDLRSPFGKKSVDRAIELAKSRGIGPDRVPDDGFYGGSSTTSPTPAPRCLRLLERVRKCSIQQMPRRGTSRCAAR
jgi:hydroxymethylglutaryl-CoA lyase